MLDAIPGFTRRQRTARGERSRRLSRNLKNVGSSPMHTRHEGLQKKAMKTFINVSFLSSTVSHSWIALCSVGPKVNNDSLRDQMDVIKPACN